MLVKSNKVGYFCRAHVPNLQILVLDLTFEAIFIEFLSILWKGPVTMRQSVQSSVRAVCNLAEK